MTTTFFIDFIDLISLILLNFIYSIDFIDFFSLTLLEFMVFVGFANFLHFFIKRNFTNITSFNSRYSGVFLIYIISNFYQTKHQYIL